MDRSVIPKILKELNLRSDSVACIYNYGSWVYGTNKPTSDRDVMIVTRLPKKPELEFYPDLDYFHQFELHKLWNQYDVCVHSVENFEKLLEKNYLLAIECIFLPDEFKIKEEIDFRNIYLEKYYDRKRLKIVAFYENHVAMNVFDQNSEITFPERSTTWNEEDEAGRTYLVKNLFHGYRYLDIAEQLIRNRSIDDFRRVSHVYQEMEELRGDPLSDMENIPKIVEFIRTKSDQWKSRLDELVSTKVVKGVFEAHVTFECGYRTDEVMAKLKEICADSKYKLIFIEFDSTVQGEKNHQLMTSSHHCGEYPNIIKQIEDEVYEKFRDFNIIRLKIESLASNEGVPETKIEKILFWDNETTYFEFHYKILVQNISSKDTMVQLKRICRNFYRNRLHLSRNAFKKFDNDKAHFMITTRLFNVGRQDAFQMNDLIIQHLERESYPPLKVEREFVVYDNHIEIDNTWE